MGPELEYKEVIVRDNYDEYSYFQGTINNEAKEGWRLMQIVPIYISIHNYSISENRYSLIFTRIKKNEET